MKEPWSNQQAFKKYLSARDDYSRGHYKLAIDKLVSLDLITKNDDVNHLLVACLYRQKSYQDAEQVLLSDVNSYTTQDKLIKLMVNVLLKNHEFIICREIVASFKASPLKTRLNQQIIYQEATFDDQTKLVKRLAKRFYHLSNFSLIQQRIVFRKSQKLPLKTFLKISKTLLVDPFLAPIMRLSILDALRKMDLEIKIKYRWINDQVYLINVGDLQAVTDTRSYHQVIKVVNDRYYHDPQQTLALKQNLRLGLSYLYPFNDREIKDPQLWVRIAVLRMQGKQPEFKNLKIKQIYYLQVKLDQLTKNLIK